MFRPRARAVAHLCAPTWSCSARCCQEALEEAFESAQNCDLFFSIGTSSLVQPAASLPFEALRSAVAVVEINLDETPLSRHAEYALRGRVGEVLPALVRAAYG